MSVDNTTELRKRIPGGKYALTRAIAERAKQLQNGALPLVEVKTPNHITVAIDEVLQGKVNFEFKSAEQIEAENASAKAGEQTAANDLDLSDTFTEETPEADTGAEADSAADATDADTNRETEEA